LAVWPSQVGWKLGVVRSRLDSRRSAHGTNRRFLECFTVPAPGCARVPASRAGLRRCRRRQVKDLSEGIMQHAATNEVQNVILARRSPSPLAASRRMKIGFVSPARFRLGSSEVATCQRL